MGEKILFAVLLCVLGCATSARSQSPDVKKKLDKPGEIQGYPCAEGFAWFYPDGHLKQCTISRDTEFGEARLPSGSIVVLTPGGEPRYAMLAHDASILGYTCRGGGPLGPAEGAATAFYPNGKLKQCWLAQDQDVQGAPCMAAGGLLGAIFHSGGAAVAFHQDGKLRSCTLSRDFGGLKRGDGFQAP
jgi:hypothetical protein